MPLSLIWEKGRPKDGVKSRYYINLGYLYDAGLIKNSSSNPDFKYGRLQFSVNSDFTNDHSLNGYKMLSASKGDIIFVWGAYLWKIVVGFIITPNISNCTQSGLVEWGLVQTKYLDRFWMNDFPSASRQYQFKNWSSIGDIRTLEIKTTVAPIALACAKFDFNYADK